MALVQVIACGGLQKTQQKTTQDIVTISFPENISDFNI